MIDNIDFEKHKFDQCKSTISINDVNIDKILGSNKVLFAKKCFKCSIGYEDDPKKLGPYA